MSSISVVTVTSSLPSVPSFVPSTPLSWEPVCSAEGDRFVKVPCPSAMLLCACNRRVLPPATQSQPRRLVRGVHCHFFIQRPGTCSWCSLSLFHPTSRVLFVLFTVTFSSSVQGLVCVVHCHFFIPRPISCSCCSLSSFHPASSVFFCGDHCHFFIFFYLFYPSSSVWFVVFIVIFFIHRPVSCLCCHRHLFILRSVSCSCCLLSLFILRPVYCSCCLLSLFILRPVSCLCYCHLFILRSVSCSWCLLFVQCLVGVAYYHIFVLRPVSCLCWSLSSFDPSSSLCCDRQDMRHTPNTS